MTKEDLEKYIQVLKIDPNSKYILIISRASGISRADIANLKLNDQFIDEILLVEGDPKEVITSLKITNK